MRATGLKRKHVNALVAEWQRRGLATGTMKNRMSALRWWAERVGRPGVVATNAAHGIGERRYVTNEDKSAVLDAEKLARVTDAHVRMSLELQAAFGLRREEAIKFTPAYADRGDRVRIKASWAKGGRAREVPIGNEYQRAVLDAARRLAGGRSLIPGGRSYAAHRKVYERQTEAAGLSRMHGLRHAYAQIRYKALTKPCSRPLSDDRHAAAAAWVGSVRRHWALSQHWLRLRQSRVARRRIAHYDLPTPRPPRGRVMLTPGHGRSSVAPVAIPLDALSGRVARGCRGAPTLRPPQNEVHFAVAKHVTWSGMALIFRSLARTILPRPIWAGPQRMSQLNSRA